MDRSRLGVSLELRSVQDPSYKSGHFRSLYKELEIERVKTTALHPQSDGIIKRIIGPTIVPIYRREREKRPPFFLPRPMKQRDRYLPGYLERS